MKMDTWVVVAAASASAALHRHEKLAIAVSKAMRGHSLQETKNAGRFHVHTKTYLDGAILKEEMERSADVLAAGLLKVTDPSLSSKFYIRQLGGTWTMTYQLRLILEFLLALQNYENGINVL